MSFGVNLRFFHQKAKLFLFFVFFSFLFQVVFPRLNWPKGKLHRATKNEKEKHASDAGYEMPMLAPYMRWLTL